MGKEPERCRKRLGGLPVKIAGIICEYNPFHLGHRYQLEQVRQRLTGEVGVVCLMSGNYVQRGEPAIYDKWSRAEAAVRQGADLVLELPITAAVNAAGYFAAGAVDCLMGFGEIDYLCFGSEGKTAEDLMGTAQVIHSPDFEEALRDALTQGISYAKAREQALKALGGDGKCLATPNNALGVDYLRRLLERGSAIKPLVIPRDVTLPTASDIRELLEAGWQDAGLHQVRLPEKPIHTLRYGERAMLGVLKTLNDQQFRDMPFGSEGLWSKVMKACRQEMALQDIILSCKTKRYTFSRLRRMLLCLFLGFSQRDMEREIPYLRILAFNDRGREILHQAKKRSAFPLVSGTAPQTEAAQTYFALESRATDLYGLFVQPGVTEPAGREKRHVPVYVKTNIQIGPPVR